jgi:hypothetical protein
MLHETDAAIRLTLSQPARNKVKQTLTQHSKSLADYRPYFVHNFITWTWLHFRRDGRRLSGVLLGVVLRLLRHVAPARDSTAAGNVSIRQHGMQSTVTGRKFTGVYTPNNCRFQLNNAQPTADRLALICPSPQILLWFRVMCSLLPKNIKLFLERSQLRAPGNI